MRAFGVILAALCLPGLPSADGRSFTSTDGRVLEGSLLRADDVNAVVGVGAGAREVTLPLARLSAADREFVTSWRLANPDLKFELSAVKSRLARRKDHEGGRKTTASREAVAALNPTGPNLIAVRARNTGGPSLIDVGLIEKVSDPAAPEALK